MKKYLFLSISIMAFSVVTPCHAAVLYPPPVFHWHKNDGTPAAGWKVHTYDKGTSTEKDTFTDSSETIANTNPIILDSRGEATVYFSGTYKLVITDENDVLQKTIDNYTEDGALTTGAYGLYNELQNGSFEVDANADGVADRWGITRYTGGSDELVTNDQYHGSKSLKCTSVGLGGCAYKSLPYTNISEVSKYHVDFSVKASVADVRVVVMISWYSYPLTLITDETIHDNSTTNPTTWTRYTYNVTPPAGARFARIELHAAHSSDPTPGTVWLDDIWLTTGHWSADIDAADTVVKSVLSRSLTAGNGLINGDFEIWQRGTSFITPATGDMLADRWKYLASSVGTVSVTAELETPDPTTAKHKSMYSMKVAVTAVDTSMDAADVVALEQRVEGYIWKQYYANNAVLSFWVKSSKTGTYHVRLCSDGNDHSYVASYEITQYGAWEKKVITIPIDYIGGTWKYNNQIGVRLSFTLAAGSNYQTTEGAWQSNTYYATSAQANFMDNTSNNFYLSQVGLWIDEAPPYFVGRPYPVEFAMAQRYLTVYGGVGGLAGRAPAIAFTATAANQRFEQTIAFPVAMRAVPDYTMTGTWDCTNCGSSGFYRSTANSWALFAVSIAAGNATFEPGTDDAKIFWDAEL